MRNYLLRALNFLDGIADRVVCILGAIALSQFPQFVAQYMQRLGGHLDEAKHTLEQYKAEAEILDMTLQEYVREHLEAGSDVFRATGEIIQNLIERVQYLEQSLLALQDASIYNRWFIFIREADWHIAANTWDNFVPGVPTTFEGLLYALVGLLLGWGVYTLLKLAITTPINAIRARKAENTPSSE